MNLRQRQASGELQASDVTVVEIRQLLAIADRELGDAAIDGLSEEGRFEHAYNAALQLCAIPLRSSGYRVPKGGWQHKRTIDSLRYTFGEVYSETSDCLERYSRKCGRLVYEQTDVATRQDAEDLLAMAKQLRTDVVAWLRTTHPELLPPGL